MPLHVGCSITKLPGRPLDTRLGFAELCLASPWPTWKTLKKQRKLLPKEIALAVPSGIGADTLKLRDTKRSEDVIRWISQAVTELEVTFVVVPHFEDSTPGHRDRELLKEFLKQLSISSQCPLVWCPAGLWESEQANAFAALENVSVGGNPAQYALSGPTTYARVENLFPMKSAVPEKQIKAAWRSLGEQAELAYLAVTNTDPTRLAHWLEQQ